MFRSHQGLSHDLRESILAGKMKNTGNTLCISEAFHEAWRDSIRKAAARFEESRIKPKKKSRPNKSKTLCWDRIENTSCGATRLDAKTRPLLGLLDSNHCRFSRAVLSRCFVPALENTGVFSAVCALPRLKSAPRKLRSTCELVLFEQFLRPTNAAGLTPSKRGGTKSAEKGRSQVVGVRIH